MGSDVQVKGIKKVILRYFAQHIWAAVVVKSESMAQHIGLENAHIIPNGVNFDSFQESDRQEAFTKTGFDNLKKNILFLADPARIEKNYNLASEAVKILADPSIVLTAIHGIGHNEIPYYLSAADILLLTSKWEGSPNVVKEAMACNCPIVSTDVGDVKEILGDTEGCYITSFEPEDVAAKLKLALDLGKRTKGREKIQHLDSTIIAERLIEVYKQVLNK
jgi:glycosyltransferase involved in cell wall biosynthesis